MRKLIIAILLSLVALAVTSSPALAANKPVVGCYIWQKERVVKKVKPRQCSLVAKHQCGGGCAADQILLDDCAWKRWKQHRARGHCTWRANMGFHKRLSVKLHRVRANRFTRARVGGHSVHVYYNVY
jgi:hypothetical protein